MRRKGSDAISQSSYCTQINHPGPKDITENEKTELEGRKNEFNSVFCFQKMSKSANINEIIWEKYVAQDNFSVNHAMYLQNSNGVFYMTLNDGIKYIHKQEGHLL